MKKLFETVQKKIQDVRVSALLVRVAGIAIAVASLIPLYEFSKAGLDYLKRSHIRETTISYADELSRAGQHERASTILENLEKVADYDANTQFHVSLITSRALFFKGGAYQDVEDNITLLIRWLPFLRDPRRQ